MLRCLVGLALLVLLLSGSAGALQVNAPGNVILQQQRKAVSIRIINDSLSEKEFSVEFLGPIESTFSQSSGQIAALQAMTVQLYLSPEESLAGQTYESTLVVESGEEKVIKKINLFFKEKEEEEEQPSAEPAPGALTGFFSLFGYSSLFSVENVLNAILVVIAAILLIAFIARLVKRLEAKK